MGNKFGFYQKSIITFASLLLLSCSLCLSFSLSSLALSASLIAGTKYIIFVIGVCFNSFWGNDKQYWNVSLPGLEDWGGCDTGAATEGGTLEGAEEVLETAGDDCGAADIAGAAAGVLLEEAAGPDWVNIALLAW